jgi:hypothetical protein
MHRIEANNSIITRRVVGDYYNYLCIVSNNTRPTKQALKNLVCCVICSAKNSKTFSRKGGDKLENLGKNTGMIKKTSTKEKEKNSTQKP